MILQCSHIHKAFLTDVVLSDVSFHINPGEKAAIVGVNGSGKSTLIKIIAGELPADQGEAILGKDVVLGYLAQNQEYNSQRTIWEEMWDAKPEIPRLEQEMTSLTSRMDTLEGDELDQCIRQFDALQERFTQWNGYAYRSEITGILKGLGFSPKNFEQPVHTLSGGEKTRVALAKMLLAAPDLIILDEPTNHLDLGAIHWLESYLSAYRGSVLIVAHDRYFLDKIVTKVVELRQTKATVYQGNYTQYQRKRSAIVQAQMKQYLNQQAAIKHQEEVITKLRQFNREKSIKRAESREKQLEKMERIEKPTEENTEMRLFFSPRYQSGKDVLTVTGLSKSFGDNCLFRDIAFSLQRGEHAAIIGDNGTGKTTLLKIINELLPADSGAFTLGANVDIGYYDQEHHVLHPEKTLFDEIQDAYPHMTNTEVRNVLAAFLFTEEEVFKQIKALSGGERGRVSLAKLMLSDANFLILDEPTNHLDIDAKGILEDALNQFEGTVLYVSHDRYFINATAHRILELTHHTLLNYIGNYDYYLEKKEDVQQAGISEPTRQSADGDTASHSDSQGFQNASGSAASGGKLSWQEQKEEKARLQKRRRDLEQVEQEIESLEQENGSLEQEMASPQVATNSAKLQEMAAKKAANDKRLEELMEQWEALSSQE